MSSCEELTFDVGGLKLAARAWGPSDGPCWLGLHGWLDNAATFDRLAPLLPDWRLVALDMPGHGHSEWRHSDANYLFVEWIPVVFDVVEALGWERFSLIGHSMGAAIAALAAGTFPERVERLVMVEGIGPFGGAEDETPERLAQAIGSRLRRVASRKGHPYESPAKAAQVLMRAVPGLSEQGALLLLERGMRPVEGGLSWRADPRLKEPSLARLTEGQIRAFLSRIAASCLLVAGSEGWRLDEELLGARVACVNGLQIEQVAGGHHVHLDNAPAVAACIRRFLIAER